MRARETYYVVDSMLRRAYAEYLDSEDNELILDNADNWARSEIICADLYEEDEEKLLDFFRLN